MFPPKKVCQPLRVPEDGQLPSITPPQRSSPIFEDVSSPRSLPSAQDTNMNVESPEQSTSKLLPSSLTRAQCLEQRCCSKKPMGKGAESISKSRKVPQPKTQPTVRNPIPESLEPNMYSSEISRQRSYKAVKGLGQILTVLHNSSEMGRRSEMSLLQIQAHLSGIITEFRDGGSVFQPRPMHPELSPLEKPERFPVCSGSGAKPVPVKREPSCRKRKL